MNWHKNFGININGSQQTNLRFADDVVLFANTPRELQTMLVQLCEHSKTALTQLMSNPQY